jgi:hypothetical protein
MGLKEDILTKFAETFMKMNPEERTEFLDSFVDKIGESIFAGLTKEEKVELLSKAVGSIAKHAEIDKDMESKMEILSTMVDHLVDNFTGGMDTKARGEMVAQVIMMTIQKLGPYIRKALGTIVEDVLKLTPERAGEIRKALTSGALVTFFKELVLTILTTLKDLLKNLVVEVYGFIKDSTPEILEFLKEAAKRALEALIRIGREILARVVEIVAQLLRSGADALVSTKNLATKVWESDEMQAIRKQVTDRIDSGAEKIKEFVEMGFTDIDTLAEKTKLPRETVRNLLLKMWEAGILEIEIGKKPKAGGSGA